jgi:hypothetical protein
MIFLEFAAVFATVAAVTGLLINQAMVQFLEYQFYRSNAWNFSLDSRLDRLKIDTRIQIYDLNLTNWQRFYIFRPVMIATVSFLLIAMIWAIFS